MRNLRPKIRQTHCWKVCIGARRPAGFAQRVVRRQEIARYVGADTNAPPASRRRGSRAIKKCRVATNARRGGVQQKNNLRTPPRMRERRLREISDHASCPSCAMQEGRSLSAQKSTPRTLRLL